MGTNDMKKKIAVFTTGWCGEILSEYLTGMMNTFEQGTVDIFLFLCFPTYIDGNEAKIGEMNIFNLPDLKDFDGVVIFGSGLNFQDQIDMIIKRSEAAGIPVFMQGQRHDKAYFIGSDNYVATIDMCKHLDEEHDAKKIVFLAGTVDSMDSEQRLQAIKDYLSEKNRSDDLLDVCYTKWENAVATRYINDYCKKGNPLPDVFICANDGLAMETVITLNNNGYNVPKDVLVCGFDYIDGSQIFDPSIASVDQCFTQMGEACGKLWSHLNRGEECDKSVIIPCRFIPGESCNCYSRDSDKIRRRVGREAFTKRSSTTYFNRKLNIIDSTVLSCVTYDEFKESLHNLFVEDHHYEGDSFHVLLEPNFGLSIYNPNISLNNHGYSHYMEVLYSSEDGEIFDREQFETRMLIPGYSGNGDNHLYVFLPLHESDSAFGYIVFRDCIEDINNHLIMTYQNRMSLVFDKFKRALSLDLINKRLLEIMKRDPLTNVNNRRAFEDKQKHLQSLINSGTDKNFAIAMFDVNNLKLVNDSMGHDAGDDYLVRACKLICNVFKHSPVYRIGGDEFVAILSGEDYDNRKELLNKLNSLMSPYSDKAPLSSDYISVACGISEYIYSRDCSIVDIIKRADEKMYEVKAEMKGHKQNS